MVPQAACAAFVAVAMFAFVNSAHAQQKFVLEGEKWKQEAPLKPGTPEWKLQEIRRAIAEDRGEDAWDMADEWIDEYPNHPLLVEAYLRRGDAKVAYGNEYKALFDYEQVIRSYPGTEQFNTALEREFEIAKQYSPPNARKRPFWGMRFVDATQEAEEIYIRIQERVPGSELGEKASMKLGDHFFDSGEMTKAAEAYSLFLVNYPRSSVRERAMLRAIQANLATFKGPEFDATGLIDAGERIRQYQIEYPAAAERMGAEALLVRIDESLGLKQYYDAKWYLTRGKDVSGVTMLRRVVKDHPQTAAARAAMEELAVMNEPPVLVIRDTAVMRGSRGGIEAATGTAPAASAPATTPSPAAGATPSPAAPSPPVTEPTR